MKVVAKKCLPLLSEIHYEGTFSTHVLVRGLNSQRLILKRSMRTSYLQRNEHTLHSVSLPQQLVFSRKNICNQLYVQYSVGQVVAKHSAHLTVQTIQEMTSLPFTLTFYFVPTSILAPLQYENTPLPVLCLRMSQ